MSEAVRAQCMVRGGLMEYVSPISPASRVWLGLPATEAALILAPRPADSRHREQLIRHTAAEATLCLPPVHELDVKRRKWFSSGKCSYSWAAGNTLFSTCLFVWIPSMLYTHISTAGFFFYRSHKTINAPQILLGHNFGHCSRFHGCQVFICKNCAVRANFWSFSAQHV